ncbi:MAG: hypothetical protein WBR29_00730 [Gammaproteobacteria bacterium]
MKAKQLKMPDDRRLQMLFLVLAGLMTALWGNSGLAAGKNSYPAMAPIEEYLIASKTQEIALARSAAPASISDHAEVLVLGKHGYDIAVKGTNGFVCLVVRSWDNDFEKSGFWNPKMRAPYCDNAAAARSVLPRYLTRTKWILAGVSKTEIQNRETAELQAGTLKAPEPGSICYMMSKQQYLNDQGKSWRPHVMFYLPRTQDSSWGANLPGSPVLMGHQYVDHTSVFMVLVPIWSDGTPAPSFK